MVESKKKLWWGFFLGGKARKNGKTMPGTLVRPCKGEKWDVWNRGRMRVGGRKKTSY